MIKPDALKKGDTIGIVSPGRMLNRERIELAVKTLEQWGFTVKTGEYILSGSHSYFSGSDRERLTDLQFMLDDPAVKAILCARGGYGTTRILDQLSFDSFRKNPKWVIGFSDITALHLKLFSLGIESLHATMPVMFNGNEAHPSLESLRKTLMGELPALTAVSSLSNKKGNGRGRVIGGNLTMILDSLGTSTEPDTSGVILALEEVDEHYYKIDRMFTQLKRNGKLQNLAGLVLGHFSDIKDTDPRFGETIEKIILEKVREYDYPVAFGFPFGHEHPTLAWIHGGEAKLTVSDTESTFVFQ